MLYVFINRWKKLLLWLIYCILCFQISRLAMYIYHYPTFKEISFLNLMKIFVGGLRFDWISIIISNILLIFILLIPVSFRKYSGVFKICVNISFAVTQVFLIFNFVDIPYFQFIHKRSTADIFFQLGGQTDVIKQIPAYLKDYWFLIILLIFMIWFNFKIYQKIILSITNENEFSLNKKSVLVVVLNVLFTTAFSIISIRGGLQRIPLDLVDATFYAEPQYTALVLNTPFSIIKSMEQKKLDELHFFDDNENINQLKLYKKYPFDTMIKKNVVVIILESFSKEYTKLGKRKSYTPFLDSLMEVSMVFENAFSNGTKSIEGIPAILSSMPSWMDNPFINSLYCNNSVPSLASLLKKENYYTAFFHGGINGTMNFDAYSKQAGFDDYFGKNEYPNSSDFDGYWGIWDEPFLQFALKKISEFKEPFFASIFTLSSHHPFNVPKQYENLLPKGNLPIHQCLRYTDLSLKKFFENAQHQKWYKNTLFIITADHTGISEDPYYSSIAGRYQIPVLIFDPQQSKQVIYKNIFQQIDILPTCLYLLHYPHTFFSLGNNYFDESVKHYALYYENGNYYLANDSTISVFSNFQLQHQWYYKNDTLLEVNLDKNIQEQNETLVKRVVQAYNNTLIHNNIKY